MQIENFVFICLCTHLSLSLHFNHTKKSGTGFSERTERATTRRCTLYRGSRVGDCRCRIGENPGAYLQNSAPFTTGIPPLSSAGPYLHQQSCQRDERAYRLAGGGADGRTTVGGHIPLYLFAHSASQCRPAGLSTRLHRVRRLRLAFAHQKYYPGVATRRQSV